MIKKSFRTRRANIQGLGDKKSRKAWKNLLKEARRRKDEDRTSAALHTLCENNSLLDDKACEKQELMTWRVGHDQAYKEEQVDFLLHWFEHFRLYEDL